MIINANHVGLVKNTLKKKKKDQCFVKNICSQGNWGTRMMRTENRMVLKSKNNRKGLVRSPRTQDNHVEFKPLYGEREQRAYMFCWGGRGGLQKSCASWWRLWLQSLPTCYYSETQSLILTIYWLTWTASRGLKYHLQWYLKSCHQQTAWWGGAGGVAENRLGEVKLFHFVFFPEICTSSGNRGLTSHFTTRGQKRCWSGTVWTEKMRNQFHIPWVRFCLVIKEGMILSQCI